MANKKISIPFSEEDLQELLNGESFDWTFNGVDVHLFMGYDDNDGKDCTKCGNPLKMFMCFACGSDSEKKDKCEECNKMRVLDNDYHLECNG